MSELIRLSAEEKARRDATERSKTELDNLVDFYRRLVETGLPLEEIPILSPVAELLSDFAYSCSMSGLHKTIVRRGEIIQTGIFRNKQSIVWHEPTTPGWQVIREDNRYYSDMGALVVERQHLYINESDLVTLDQVSPVYIANHEKRAFDFSVIRKSILSTLFDNHIKPLERPRE
jgi:hypothetical protein